LFTICQQLQPSSAVVSAAARQSRGFYLYAAFVLTAAKVNRDRNQGKAPKARICKGFQFHKGLLFPESSRKRRTMPMGEVRLSEQTL